MLTYAGKPLLLEDPQGQVQEFIDRNLCLEDLRAFGAEPPAQRRSTPRGYTKHKVDLAGPNFSLPPRPRVNQLYWPTGASRWAFGLFLVDETTLDAIYNLAGVNGFGTFYAEEPAQAISLSTSMYMLAPRYISNVDAGMRLGPRLFLLPLVDERYYWQILDSGNLAITQGVTTWTQVFNQLTGSLSSFTADTTAGAYLTPDYVEMTRRFENTAVLLDCAAWSVGQRIIRDFDGQVYSADWSRSDGFAATNSTADAWKLVAGGSVAGAKDSLQVPEQIRVVFPKARSRFAMTAGDVHSVTVSAATAGWSSGTVAGTTKVFQNTAYADFTSNSVAADNQTTLESLALKIAQDYYRGFEKRHDLTYAGLKVWHPTGWDDYVLFRFASQRSDARVHNRLDGLAAAVEALAEDPTAAESAETEADDVVADSLVKESPYICTQRIVSMPLNVGVTSLFHSAASTDEDKLRRIELTTAFANKEATAKSLTWNGAAYVATGAAFTILDPFSTWPNGQPGEKGYVVFAEDRSGWEVLRGGGTGAIVARIKLTSDMRTSTPIGFEADAQLFAWAGGPDYVAGDSIRVYDPFGLWSDSKKDSRGYAVWATDRLVWEIIQLEFYAKFIRFKLPSIIHGAITTSFAITSASEFLDWWFGTQPALPLTIQNRNKLTAIKDALGTAVWNDRQNEYILISVEFGGLLLGKTLNAGTFGGFTSVEVYDGGQLFEAPKFVLTALNRFGAIDEGKWVWLANNGWGWYIIAAECP